MALSSRWLESLQQQLLAEQGGEPFDPRLGMDTSDPASQAPASAPGPVGATSGLAMQPTGSPSYLSQVGAGFAQGGVGGGLASFFTDPNADRSQSGSNAWDVFRGITKSIGRAIGSAYGNPNFALAAQAQDDNSALGRERLYAYQQQVQAQIENDLQQRQAEAEAKAQKAAIMKAVSDLDPTTPEGNREAVARLSALGAFDVAAKVKALSKSEGKSAPTVREFNIGDRIVTRQFDEDSGTWKDMAEAPRYKPDSGGGGGSGGPLVQVQTPDGQVVYVPRSEAVGMQAPSSGSRYTGIESSIADDYRAESKSFGEVKEAYGRIGASVENPSAAGDMALLYSYMKLLDPGSVVREAEFATAAQSGSLPEQIQAAASKVVNGQRLTPEQRADFVDRSKKLFRGYVKRQGDLEKQYRDNAKRRGADPDAAVIDRLGSYRALMQDAEEAPLGAPPGATPTGKTSRGKPVYRLPDGKLWVAD